MAGAQAGSEKGAYLDALFNLAQLRLKAYDLRRAAGLFERYLRCEDAPAEWQRKRSEHWRSAGSSHGWLEGKASGDLAPSGRRLCVNRAPELTRFDLAC